MSGGGGAVGGKKKELRIVRVENRDESSKDFEKKEGGGFYSVTSVEVFPGCYRLTFCWIVVTDS